MRPLWKDILAAVWLGMILPGIVLQGFVLKERYRSRSSEPKPQVAQIIRSTRSIPVRGPDGMREDMELDTYLTGVLLAEMPAAFHEEALKAQAVAARTYTWKAYITGGKHGDGSVCTDAACCQAYMDEASYLSCGGTEAAIEKMRSAVEATSDFVLTYEGELIEATYFSSSGGSTEEAAAVWGADYPYLQAVSSPEEVFTDSVTYTVEEFRKRIGKDLPGDPETWFHSVNYTEGGGVASMEICGEGYTGVELRTLLGLRSTAFQIQTDDQSVIFTTKGYGHRVGMSQYGANTMAEAGMCYQKILQHYYPGTVLIPLE